MLEELSSLDHSKIEETEIKDCVGLRPLDLKSDNSSNPTDGAVTTVSTCNSYSIELQNVAKVQLSIKNFLSVLLLISDFPLWIFNL